MLRADLYPLAVCVMEKEGVTSSRRKSKITFNWSAFCFSTAHSFRRLSLEYIGFDVTMTEILKWRKLKTSEIFSFI